MMFIIFSGSYGLGFRLGLRLEVSFKVRVLVRIMVMVRLSVTASLAKKSKSSDHLMKIDLVLSVIMPVNKMNYYKDRISPCHSKPFSTNGK